MPPTKEKIYQKTEMGNCFKKCCRQRQNLNSSFDSIGSNEPLKQKEQVIAIHRYQQPNNVPIHRYQHTTYANVGVNGWSGRGIRCDGLNGLCDGRGSDCSARRGSLHPNALYEDRKVNTEKAGLGAGVAAAAFGASVGVRPIQEEPEDEFIGSRVELGPRHSVRVVDSDDHGAFEPICETAVCTYDH